MHKHVVFFGRLGNHKRKRKSCYQNQNGEQLSKKITLEGSIDIIIDQNGQEGITIETDENIQDLVVTEVNDGKLKITYQKNVSPNPTKMVVHVSCKDLYKISSSGSGDIKSKVNYKKH